MTNLIINKNGTLYTLPDSVSCGTVNGVDIKEIEVNNNGSLITVWKLQSDITVDVVAKYVLKSYTVYSSYWLRHNNKYYAITNPNIFTYRSALYANEGALCVLMGGSSSSSASKKDLQKYGDGFYGHQYEPSTTSTTRYYTPSSYKTLSSTEYNCLFGSKDKKLNSINIFSFKANELDSIPNLTVNEIKTRMSRTTHRYELGTFTITSAQFKQATGVNP